MGDRQEKNRKLFSIRDKISNKYKLNNVSKPAFVPKKNYFAKFKLDNTKQKCDTTNIFAKKISSENVISSAINSISDSKPKISNSKWSFVTAEEKYKLLLKIDNNETKYEDNLKLDRPTLSGTCLDMCPEKERYLRDFQGNFSDFEKTDKGCDYNRAVKDYERCSADQKEPPSHDLRPSEVLQRTMDYLLTEIGDTDVQKYSWRKWYQFLWSRTRAIRKDITQQNLCSAEVVHIVETITRLHIFCAARLCEEDKDVFDDRLNDENLKNCLQTLKDLYSDMPADSCVNEPEFRSYMIIMQLDEGKVHGLTNKVFNSPHVTLTLGIHQAYVTNNYVRFFKLVRQCNFILSCLLHRYFVSVRIKAFEVINRVYMAKRTVEAFLHLQSFSELLAFDTAQQCEFFCRQIGLDCFDTGPNHRSIVLSSGFSRSQVDAKSLIRRSQVLVDSKLADHRLSFVFAGDREVNRFGCSSPPKCVMVSFDEYGAYTGQSKLPVNGDWEDSSTVVQDPTTATTSSGTGAKISLSFEKPSLKYSNKLDFQSSDENCSDSGENKSNLVWKDEDECCIIGEEMAVARPLPPTKRELNSYFDYDEEDFPRPSKHVSATNNTKVTNSLFSQQQPATTKSNLFTNDSTPKQSVNIFGSRASKDVSSLFSQNVSKPTSIFSTQQITTHQVAGTPPITTRRTFDRDSILTQHESVKLHVEDVTVKTKRPPLLSDVDKNELAANTVQGVITETVVCIVKKTAIETRLEEQDKQKNFEAQRIYDGMLAQTVTEVTKEAVRMERAYLIKDLQTDIFHDLLTDIFTETFAVVGLKLRRKNEQAKKVRLARIGRMFRGWRVGVAAEVRERKCWSLMPPGPQMLDPFTSCQRFCGRVYAVDTSNPRSSEPQYSNHPALARLSLVAGDKIPDQSAPRIKPTQVCSTQTLVSVTKRTLVDICAHVQQFLTGHFLKNLNMQIEMCQMANRLHPTPDLIVADFDSILDELCGQLALSEVLVDLDELRLQIPPPTEDGSRWQDRLERVANLWWLTDHQQNKASQQMSDRLAHTNLTDDADCLLPWLSIAAMAVHNIIADMPEMLGHHLVAVDTSICSMPIRLRLHMLESCPSIPQPSLKTVLEPKLIPSLKRPSKRVKAYQDIVTKVAKFSDLVTQVKTEVEAPFNIRLYM